MKTVKITLSFSVEEKDLKNEHIKEFISSVKSGKMKNEFEQSAKIMNSPIQNVEVNHEIA